MLNSKNAPAKPLRRQIVYSNDVKKLRMQSSTPRLTALARLGSPIFRLRAYNNHKARFLFAHRQQADKQHSIRTAGFADGNKFFKRGYFGVFKLMRQKRLLHGVIAYDFGNAFLFASWFPALL